MKIGIIIKIKAPKIAGKRKNVAENLSLLKDILTKHGATKK